jgi:hypothetical protein
MCENKQYNVPTAMYKAKKKINILDVKTAQQYGLLDGGIYTNLRKQA